MSTMVAFARRAGLEIALSFGALFNVGCSDPVHDELVTSLGPENPNVPVGPNHRAGQPCLACHGTLGPAQLQFTVGGTIYQEECLPEPAAGAHVAILDQAGSSTILTSNAVGNFFATAQVYNPTFPIRMAVAGADYSPLTLTPMQSASNREGSCATCHTPTAGPTSPGPVFLSYNPQNIGKTGSCLPMPMGGGSDVDGGSE